MSAIKTRKIIWHECDESPLEDPRDSNTEQHLICDERNGWVLYGGGGCGCNGFGGLNFCPWCRDRLPHREAVEYEDSGRPEEGRDADE